MLWALLSAWNYEVYWEKHEKFISEMYSISYKISYKIVRMTRIIIRERLGTPMVWSQDANCFLRGRSGGATICLSLRRSAFMQLLLLSPWGPDNQDFNEHGKVRFVLLFSSYSAVRNKISRKRTKWKGIRRIRYVFYIFWEEDKKN